MSPHTSEYERAEEERNRPGRRTGWVEDILILLIALILIGIATKLLW